jgi:hypothetical protein
MGSNGIRKPASIVLTTVLLVAGCASGPRMRYKHEFTMSPGQEHHAGLARALLVPIGFTNEKPVAGLDVADDRITTILVGHLESKGISVERVDPGSFKRIAESAREAARADRKSGASGVVSADIGFEDVIPKILEELDQKPDLVIAPNIVMRAAAYQGTRTLAWDGVKRRETVFDLRMSGDGVPVASIRIAIHAQDGSSVFSGYGGLEPIFRIDRALEKYVQREDLFDDERNLREGICIAFYPYFGMEETCSR